MQSLRHRSASRSSSNLCGGRQQCASYCQHSTGGGGGAQVIVSGPPPRPRGTRPRRHVAVYPRTPRRAPRHGRTQRRVNPGTEANEPTAETRERKKKNRASGRAPPPPPIHRTHQLSVSNSLPSFSSESFLPLPRPTAPHRPPNSRDSRGRRLVSGTPFFSPSLPLPRPPLLFLAKTHQIGARPGLTPPAPLSPPRRARAGPPSSRTTPPQVSLQLPPPPPPAAEVVLQVQEAPPARSVADRRARPPGSIAGSDRPPGRGSIRYAP
ncbi:hypothetical protein GQ55_7G229500 [Panicum hallii var. hallii]|uniref:Uncharacterized protein n=1 Tax=Panicum hallii var. hallii TaxID=1504633 RepID=A0A2T7CY36_9POAL|nr:hypothetical protein GQ55_7G229500 [Panicum hallii var. hallii]